MTDASCYYSPFSSTLDKVINFSKTYEIQEIQRDRDITLLDRKQACSARVLAANKAAGAYLK